MTATEVGVWHWDLQHDRLLGDANLARLFGFAEAAPGPLEVYLERIHLEDRPRVTAAIDRAVRRGGAYDEEYRVLWPDGTVRWLHARGRVDLGPEGRAASFPGVIVDVTERRQAETLLRESEERYRLSEARVREREARLSYALEATRTAAFEFLEGSPEWIWSQSSRSVLGVSEPSTAEDLLAIVHPDDRAALAPIVLGSLREVPADGSRRAVAFRILHPETGATRWVQLHARQQGSGADGRARTSGILTDITDRRSAEEQAQAAQRIEAVGRLAGGVAHEINNALSGVLGFTDLALRRLRPEDPLRQTLEQVSRAGGRAASVTRQLMAFGRRQVLQLRDTDVAEVVRRFEPMLRQALGPDKLLVLCLPEEPAVARIDAGQVEQVLLNLALNARDAMGYGGTLEVDVAVEGVGMPRPAGIEDAGPGPWVWLTVTDEGEGMDEATRARLFEPFFTTKPVGKGTGLGLATVYGIVKQSQGHIAVTSAPGRGAAFHILLPRVPGAPAEDAPAPPVPSAPPGRRMRILVVDDEPGVRLAIGAMLEREGHDAVVASSTGEALARLAVGPWDLVVSDLVMPGGSGAVLAARLRMSRPDLPLLFVSGHTEAEAMRRGMMPDGASFLQKPFTMDALLERVAALLRAG